MKPIKISLNPLLILLCPVLVFGAAQGRYNHEEGKYLDPSVKTNINKVEPLFEENIENWQSFERDLKAHQNSVAGSIGKNNEANNILGTGEAKAKADELSQIDANELESRGRNQALKEKADEYFVDYSKPGNMQIKNDMDEIADASGKMMNVILSMIKDLGIDCKSVKGNKVIEPQYFIDLKERQDRDKGETIYDQFFCEQPRREYDCLDEVRLTCKKKGIKWGPWQDKQIKVPGRELIGFGQHMFTIEKPRDTVFDYYLKLGPEEYDWYGIQTIHFNPEPSHIQAARSFLATKHLNATIENISDQMTSSSEGDHFSISGVNYCGRTLGSKDYAFPTYVINYKYRDGSPACLEWEEDWSEECKLQ